MLLWIKGANSPQQIRDKLLDCNSDFSNNLIAYLNSAFSGDFIAGSLTAARSIMDDNYSNVSNVNLPTHQLPSVAPSLCSEQCHHCNQCNNNEDWWSKYKTEVDFILLKSNIHDHELGLSENDKGKGLLGPYCEKKGKCKARFPRPCYPETVIDLPTGHINMKKTEPMLNTIAYIITFLLRCNTDVTCLLSGTAIKAVIAYITDYISKNPLKTYMVFDIIRSIYNKNKQ
ncbi:hypothetical protein GYMLUDRAFT_133354, partial [Collybiopsis luxurians FD-317 M1]